MEIIKYSGNKKKYKAKPGDVFEWHDRLFRVHGVDNDKTVGYACRLCCFTIGSSECGESPGCGTSGKYNKYYTETNIMESLILVVKEAEDEDNKI